MPKITINFAYIIVVAIIAAVAALGTYLGSQEDYVEPYRPNCPTEDSCDIDYRDGGWYIVEDPNDRIECDNFEGESVCIDGSTGKEVPGYRVSR